MSSPEIHIQPAQTPEQYRQAKALILEYVAGLGFDLAFQHFDREIDQLETMYGAPEGGLLLVLVDGRPVGVAGIRKFEGEDCELKRMYIQPECRNLGLGKRLLQESIQLAQSLGYSAIKLDTAASMEKAIRLYREQGFVEIAPYRYNPHGDAKYFERRLN